MRVKRIIKPKIVLPIQKQPKVKVRRKYVKKVKESPPLIPNYAKIKQILIELQKVEDVVNTVKTQLKELESWKGKLEDTLCSYVNKNSEKSCNDIKREILRDIQNSKVNGEAKKQWTKGDDSKENRMNLQKPNRNVMKTNNQPPSNPSTEAKQLTSESLRKADEHLKEVRVYTEKGFKNLYRCLICKKTLTIVYNARYHVRRVHFGERVACPKCNTQFYEGTKLSKHRKVCLGNRSRKQDENTNIQKKRGRPSGVKRPTGVVKKSKVSYANIKVRNPFKNFSLSKCLNVKVLVEPLPVPDNIQNLIDETPQRTKRRLKLAAALEQSNIDFTQKKKSKNVLTNIPSAFPSSSTSSFSYMPNQKIDGRKSSQKQRKKKQNLPFGLTNNNNFQFSQQFLPNPNIIDPFSLPYMVKQEGEPISDMPGASTLGELNEEGEEILPIVDGSYACLRCNEFFPSASDLKMHHLLHGHPVVAAPNTVSLGYADVMDMNNGIPMDNYFPYQATNPNSFNEFQDFSAQQHFSNEFVPLGVPSYFINNTNATFPSSSFTSAVNANRLSQNQSRAPAKTLTRKEELKFINSKIREIGTPEDTSFQCVICNKLFKRRANVLTHVKRMHFGDTFRRVCTGCSLDFYDGRSLNAHQSKCELYKELLTSASLNDNVTEIMNDPAASTT